MYGTRWSHPGRPLASTSATLSLAVLEYLVHVDPRDIPGDLVRVKVGIPDTIRPRELDRKRLPTNWRRYPAPEELAKIGDEWLEAGKSLLLVVPSAVIPEEDNVLVNPRHRDFSHVALDGAAPFDFDERLFTRR